MSIIMTIEGRLRFMRFITVTELKQKATQIISEIESTKEEVVVTKNGKPVALIQFISNNAFALKESAKGKGVKHGKAEK
jgi:prevent-host-death family protein